MSATLAPPVFPEAPLGDAPIMPRLLVTYAPPGDRLRLVADHPAVFARADRLWTRADTEDDAGADPIEVSIEVFVAPAPLRPESRLTWSRTSSGYRAVLDEALWLDIDVTASTARGRVAEGLVGNGSPGLRTLLESATAALFARRAFQVLHAGAVVGPAGAVVIRGPSGAGKSTLVAAAHMAGLSVLGDESVLVSRTHPNRLASTVRDLTLRRDSATLLGIVEKTEEAFSGGEEKRRLPLHAVSPEERVAERAATLLIGPREPGPARLVPLSAEQFTRAFAEGEIPQEREGGDPDPIARAWAESGGMRLDGASDLEGAVRIVKRLAGIGSTG